MANVTSTHVEGLYHRLTVTLPAAEADADAARERRADAGDGSDDEAWQHAWDKVRQHAYSDALKQTGLRPVSEPEFAWKSAQSDTEYVFTATVEVLPTVDLGNLDNVAIERPEIRISHDDVTHALELLRQQHSEFESVARPAATGDRVVFDYMGALDGNAFEGSAEQGASAVLGNGDALEDMEAALVGRAADETFTVPITFPDDYQVSDLRGRCAQFDVVVKTVAEPRLPELGPEFVQRLGVASGSLDELREQLRQRLAAECAQAQRRFQREQLSQALLDAVPVTVPETLVSHELQRIRETFESDTVNADAPDESLPDEPLQATAHRRVALSLILSEVIRQRDIRLKESRVEKKLDELAGQYGEPKAVKRRYRADTQLMHNVKAVVMEEAGFDSVMHTAHKTDVPMSLDALLEAAG